jgi:hypothetical protein
MSMLNFFKLGKLHIDSASLVKVKKLLIGLSLYSIKNIPNIQFQNLNIF